MNSVRRAVFVSVFAAAVWFGCAGLAMASSPTESLVPLMESCDAGGPGSLSCTGAVGGCSVTCQSGYYACCNGDGANSVCYCSKNGAGDPDTEPENQ